ncbi:hypothetical protein NB037_10735 [Rathayibacter sp. ZW T2_19]|uniref:Lipoprotein n=1 Tax=Rathayibacter rubneri TaxID=2950106 RepID=A0A9X2DYY2_9MICO|nr:hypothetical protein [Rathayibacter rubneri]MCM6762891.1 hypothetical protein [Rathayibacter rubneri]
MTRMRTALAATTLLGALALAGCTDPAPAAPERTDSASLLGARDDARERLRSLTAALTGPQDDAFDFARAADAAPVEGVELIGIESYEAPSAEEPFGSLSFRTPVDASEYPEADDVPEAFCFQVPFASTGAVEGDFAAVEIDCPADAVVITPPAEG